MRLPPDNGSYSHTLRAYIGCHGHLVIVRIASSARSRRYRSAKKVGEPLDDVGDESVASACWVPVAGVGQVGRLRCLAIAGVRGEVVRPGVHVLGAHR